MKPIDRNPDVNLDVEDMPAGLQLVAGKNLMQAARARGIPFGVAGTRQPCGNSTRMETVGLVIRDGDVRRFTAALEGKMRPAG